MNICSTPKQPGDTRYVQGLGCTWHGPIAQADQRRQTIDASSYGDEEPQHFDAVLPCCPKCFGTLCEFPSEAEFLTTVRAKVRAIAGYDAMVMWSKGKCFPDFDTMQSAWYQAMEGQV